MGSSETDEDWWSCKYYLPSTINLKNNLLYI